MRFSFLLLSYAAFLFIVSLFGIGIGDELGLSTGYLVPFVLAFGLSIPLAGVGVVLVPVDFWKDARTFQCDACKHRYRSPYLAGAPDSAEPTPKASGVHDMAQQSPDESFEVVQKTPQEKRPQSAPRESQRDQASDSDNGEAEDTPVAGF